MTFDLTQLRPEEQAALAKAQSHGVNAVARDGSTVDVAAQTPKVPAAAAAVADKAAPAANASGDVAPTKAAAAPATTDAAAKPAKPDWVPEKFWDADKGEVRTEAMAKSYAELERSRSQTRPQELPAPTQMGQQPNTQGTQQGTQQNTEQTPEAKAAADAAAAKAAQDAASAKLVADRQAASNDANADITRDGKISDATYAKLESVGYSRTQVDQYVSGLQAQATLQLNAMYEGAGGKAEFDKMVSWGANGGYTAEEASAFDAALKSGDKAQQTLAINGLKARFAAEFGKGKSTVINSNPGNTSATNAFKTQAELMKAMQDPKYTSGDPAFHQEVAQRIAASHRAGIDIGIRVM